MCWCCPMIRCIDCGSKTCELARNLALKFQEHVSGESNDWRSKHNCQVYLDQVRSIIKDFIDNDKSKE